MDKTGKNGNAEQFSNPLLRMIEAMIFASSRPVTIRALAQRLPVNTAEEDIHTALFALQHFYAGRGVNLVQIGEAYALRTAPDLGFLLRQQATHNRKLSRAAMEVLAIIAYHQPVTRAELEEIRGVETSKGTLDVLMETGWIKLRGRRRTPGRPVTYGTTSDFLEHFSLSSITDLPGMEELKGAGLLSNRLSEHFCVPDPGLDPDELKDKEEPFTDVDLEGLGLFPPKSS